MWTFIVRGLFFAFGFLLISESDDGITAVVMFLVALILTALGEYFQERRFILGTFLFYLVMSFLFPVGIVFLPIMTFDMGKINLWKVAPLVFLPILSHQGGETLFLLLLAAMATITGVVLQRLQQLVAKAQLIRDNSTELQRELVSKNQLLQQKYDDDVQLTKLEERTRIAREIHDNVGHLLSRSLLQVGAIQAINQEEKLGFSLSAVQETLTSAMSSIRQSVHDLRDDSLQMEWTLQKMLEPLEMAHSLDYDMTDQVPSAVKYCLLGVAKEALTNVARHSNGNQVRVVLREHPAFYQLLVQDNGTIKPDRTKTGMGIENMEERVQGLSGHMNITFDNGCRVFVSLPKTGGKEL